MLKNYPFAFCNAETQHDLGQKPLTRHCVVWRIVRRNPPVLSAWLLLLHISGGHHIVRRLCFTGSAWQYDDPVSVPVTTHNPLSPDLRVPPSVRVAWASSPWPVSRLQIRVGRDQIHDGSLKAASHWLSCHHWPLDRPHCRHGSQLYSCTAVQLTPVQSDILLTPTQTHTLILLPVLPLYKTGVQFTAPSHQLID